ncbi:MAG TPA: peptide chain release factor N(5)-glutamine methyltransferase [Ktedonobacteraceae bacterium]|nr:peptide chain release factor N(5)-glutamine methyltransferase [Ktedonobacteraceae bacterium]
MTTIREALSQATQQFTLAGLQHPRLDAQVLLDHVLEVERATLYTYPNRQLTPEQEQRFIALVARRARGEPVAYLTGHREFYSLDFLVDNRVLVPRPETEHLVDEALKIIQGMLQVGQQPIVADIGTGSGIIPITLAVQEPRLPHLYGCDISPDALEVARLNCQLHHVEQQIRLLQGNLLDPLPEPVDVLTANLPYIGTDEMSGLERDVRDYEPYLALFSGPLGLDLLQRFLIDAQQPGKLKPGAILLLEIGYQQREPLTQLLQNIWPSASFRFMQDYGGYDRLLYINT